MNREKGTNLLGLELDELTTIVEAQGEPRYRARQLFEGLYNQRYNSFGEFSTLPHSLHDNLTKAGFHVHQPVAEKKFVSVDGTVRYLLALVDGQTVETVWMPEGDGGESGEDTEPSSQVTSGKIRLARGTICLSSQVGCAVDCEFCLTALLGLKRNLSAGEMIGQVCAVLKDQGVSPPLDRVNLVFMGMGEPFLNYDNFVKAVRLLGAGVGIPPTRMTVSTAGVVPRISDLGREPIRPRLAISLNASNDQLRTRLMPINKKWNLDQLMAAAREYPLRPKERLTFEYVLLDEVNDSAENARQVVELVRGIRAKVNLIALNPGPGIDFKTPRPERVTAFQKILIDAQIPTFVRRPRGRDIYAACGQLKRTVELLQPSL